MRNYLLFILLVIICMKWFTSNFEYMTTNDRIANVIGLGYNDNIAKRIIEDSTEICTISDKSSGDAVGLPTQLNEEEKKELLFKDYKLKIKSGQQFHKKLNELEEDVFINFYGPDEKKWKPIYDKWKEKRNSNIDTLTEKQCRTIVSTSTLSDEELILEIKEKIKTLSYLEKINVDNYVNDYLSETSDPNLDIRKMQYRSIEEEKIHIYNSYINWIYYLAYVTLLLLLYSQSKLNIMKHFIIYIGLFLLPIVIYPYTFKLFQYILDSLNNESKNILPKNAFMND